MRSFPFAPVIPRLSMLLGFPPSTSAELRATKRTKDHFLSHAMSKALLTSLAPLFDAQLRVGPLNSTVGMDSLRRLRGRFCRAAVGSSTQ